MRNSAVVRNLQTADPSRRQSQTKLYIKSTDNMCCRIGVIVDGDVGGLMEVHVRVQEWPEEKTRPALTHGLKASGNLSGSWIRTLYPIFREVPLRC